MGRRYGARIPPGRSLEFEIEALENWVREHYDLQHGSDVLLAKLAQFRERAVSFYGPAIWPGKKRKE
jgi:hypothetical protein